MKGATHDDLDRYYTPDGLALACVRRLFGAHRTPWDGSHVLEPSVGGGAFVRALRKNRGDTITITGVDLDPDAKGLALCDHAITGDFPAVVESLPKRQHLVIGNPPFTGPEAIRHVEAAFNAAPRGIIAMILPWGPLGGVQRWRHLMDGPNAPAAVYPIAPRPWPAQVREVALVVWTPGAAPVRTVSGPWLDWTP